MDEEKVVSVFDELDEATREFKPETKTEAQPEPVAPKRKQPAPRMPLPKAKKDRGRPKMLSEETRKATQIFMTDPERAILKSIGGDMSNGFRVLIEHWNKTK